MDVISIDSGMLFVVSGSILKRSIIPRKMQNLTANRQQVLDWTKWIDHQHGQRV